MGYGLKVVAADGTTVIIDGESNMFKIAATGTGSITGPNGNLTTGATTLVDIDLSLGLSYAPALLGYLLVGADPTAEAWPLPFPNFSWTEPEFVPQGEIIDLWFIRTMELASGGTRVRLSWDSREDSTAFTYTLRYYVLKEVAF